MWDGFTSVGSGHAPIVWEGRSDAAVEILNAGPGTVFLLCWEEPNPGEKSPTIRIEARPGDIRAASGRLIRVKLDENEFRSAAVGWRFIHCERAS